MGKPIKFVCLLCAVSVFAILPPDAKAADISSCADITAPGSYVVVSDIVCTDGNLTAIPSLPSASAGILISASNVLLDLNGYELIGPGGVAAVSTYGIYAENAFSDISIENGTVSGFETGIALNGGTSDLVTNVTIVNASTTVPEPSSAAYLLVGLGFLCLALRRREVNISGLT